jgi:hypothetical protein
MKLPGNLLFASPTEMHMASMDAPGSGTSASCKGVSGGKNGHMVGKLGPSMTVCEPDSKKLPADPDKNLFLGKCPDWVMSGDVVRYRINKDASRVPNLERSVNGADGPWEIVARGIDDLQVSYRHDSTTGWNVDPGQVVVSTPPVEADYATLVWRVRVDLSARVVGQPNLAGKTTSVVDVGGQSNVRGRLVSETAPRAAQAFLASMRHEG